MIPVFETRLFRVALVVHDTVDSTAAFDFVPAHEGFIKIKINMATLHLVV